MKGFIRVASAIPKVVIGNPAENVKSIACLCDEMNCNDVALAVFPEMCITGYTCGDLFHNRALLAGALESVKDLVRLSKGWKMAIVIGLPLALKNTLYNVAMVISHGRIWGIVPKTYIPNYNEFYEKRWWHSGGNIDAPIKALFSDSKINFSKNQIFNINGANFGVEICEDLWTPIPPSSHLALEGADIIVNLSASDAVIGKYDYIRNLVASQSARCISGYVYASAGFGESSTDLVFDGISLIAENGKILREGKRWQNEGHYVTADIDIFAIRHDRMTMSSFADCRELNKTADYTCSSLPKVNEIRSLNRTISPTPFVPEGKDNINARCDEIINIQAAGLAQRLKATNTKNIVVGVSGGLDSTLALLVAVRTFDRLGLDRKGIHAITMPGFGTTDRTYTNAVSLIKALGTSFREISIVPAVNQHFSDIGHNPENKDVTYENSQARQRTLLLMDIANQVGGMVLGTGDLSELALGWATYNGDHMSMYSVNAGVPKTLVRYLVSRFADGDAMLIKLDDFPSVSRILYDIVDTPISPELLPADKDGAISQKTEDLVGPYELHDFFLYYTLRYGLSPQAIFERAEHAFADQFDNKTIIQWLRTFTRRFFSQQFKRSCLPDGPKVGSVCLSPRGDWRMPSDASAALWLKEIESLEENYN